MGGSFDCINKPQRRRGNRERRKDLLQHFSCVSPVQSRFQVPPGNEFQVALPQVPEAEPHNSIPSQRLGTR